MGFFNDRQKDKIKQTQAQAKDFSVKLDKKTDSWLVKLGKSKWTLAIALGIILAAGLLGALQGMLWL